MATVRFNQAFDMTIDTTVFTNGHIDFRGNDEAFVSGANGQDQYTARIFGDDIKHGGPVDRFVAQSNGAQLFSVVGVDTDMATLIADRADQHALSNDLFGGDDRITGSDGKDVILGYGGDDKLFGGDRADTLIGGAGADKLSGGAGRDVFVFGEAGSSTTDLSTRDKIMDLQDGIDTVDVSGLHLGEDAQFTVHYNDKTNVTVFSIDTDNDGTNDFSFAAVGHHTQADTHFQF